MTELPKADLTVQYASAGATGVARTPVGIVLFAANHILLGGVLLLSSLIIYRHAAGRQATENWVLLAVLLAGATPMLAGGVALLLKGSLAWWTAVASFTLLAVLEAGALAYAIGMTVRYLAQGNPDAQWALLFVAAALGVATLSAVVVGYLGGEKARVTFALPPGETPAVVRTLRTVVLTLYAAAALIGPLLRNVRAIYPD